MKKLPILLLTFLLVACGTQESVSPTNSSERINTFISSDTPIPTSTPQPTNTIVLPTATATRAPTSTPAFEPGTIITNPTDSASMAYIPPGEFMMGNESGKADEQPVHLVYTDGFWIYQYEVTNAQYSLCIAAGKCGETFTTDEFYDSQYANNPVIYLSWQDAQTYCEWSGGRLPTEAEWEKAARGGLEGMTYPWGNQEPVCTIGAVNGAQFIDCVGESNNTTVPVGSFAPNGYELYDMAGNAREWVNDYYKEDYYAQQEYDNPQGPRGGKRGARGGNFRSSSSDLAVSVRWWSVSYYTGHSVGFRCAVTP
jgi:formylglycine-generating enzyme required for sulfatase activity